MKLRGYLQEAILYLSFILLAIGTFSILENILFAAPAPFRTRQKKPHPLTVKNLSGVWLIKWENTFAKVTLSPDGSYKEIFNIKEAYEETKVDSWGNVDSDFPVYYVGTWGVDEDKCFWISERLKYSRKGEYHFFKFIIDPVTMEGVRDLGNIRWKFVKRLSSPVACSK